MSANDEPRLYGVLGHPVAHSLSPFIMNRAFRQSGIDAVYLRFDVRPDQLDRAVGGLRALGARGVNVTFPFKEEIVRFVDVPSPDASLIGAVNTIVMLEGQMVGHNTDASGTVGALETAAGVPPRDRHIFMFGAGGSARAAAVGLLGAGAASVTFGVRTPANAVGPVGRLRERFPLQAVDILPLDEPIARDDRRRAFRRAHVVINATPVGMGTDPGASLIEDPDWIDPEQCFFDFIYYPGRTRFLETASERGATIVGGAALLVHQAAGSFRQWTGSGFDTVAMLDSLEAAFPERTVRP
ncbi:MAG: shikimate dehydrogenase [Candidatus Latescibacterota bacterium]